MRNLKTLILLVGLVLPITTTLSNNDDAGAVEDVKAAFVVLDKDGNIASRFSRGEPAVFRITLTNPTAHDIKTTYTAPGYDISIYAQGTDHLVWQAHAEALFAQVIAQYVIKAREAKVIDTRWDLTDLNGALVSRGTYEAKAHLNIGLMGDLPPLLVTIK